MDGIDSIKAGDLASLVTLGLEVRAKRKLLKRSQSEVAAAAGCRRHTVAELEKGRVVTTLTMLRVLHALGLQLSVRERGTDFRDLRAVLGEDWES